MILLDSYLKEIIAEEKSFNYTSYFKNKYLILVFLFLIIGNVNAQTLFKLWGSNGIITQGNPKTSYDIKMDATARGNFYHKNTQVTKYLGNAIMPAQLFFSCSVGFGQ